MKYRFEDLSGEIFQGNTYAQVVSDMRKASWQIPGKAAYMQNVAKRIFALDRGKSKIDTSTAVEFIKTLVSHRWLRRVK